MAYLNFIVVEIVADFMSQVLVIGGERARRGGWGEWEKRGRRVGGGEWERIFDMRS